MRHHKIYREFHESIFRYSFLEWDLLCIGRIGFIEKPILKDGKIRFIGDHESKNFQRKQEKTLPSNREQTNSREINKNNQKSIQNI